MARAVEKYLASHAEPEIGLEPALRAEGRARFGHVLTVPAYGEAESLFALLRSLPAGAIGPALVLLVVNARDDSPAWVHAANRATLERLRAESAGRTRLAAGAELLEHGHGALVVIDRASPGRTLPARQGVGLARKIGADLALALWAEGRVESPWIHCTDADATLPRDYFGRAAGVEAAAIVYPFRHEGRDALEYEIALRYYVEGLRSAGSPYAFHTIGSTLAIHADAYARARGFPRRTAAEDFYLLNKLAKLGPIAALDGDRIRLSARESTRTPFGTGRAVQRQRRTGRTLLYHPDAFSHLAVWLAVLDELGRGATPKNLRERLGAHASLHPHVDAQRIWECLQATGAARSAVEAAERESRPAQRGRRLRERFDAQRTLKLVHALRDRGLPSLPLREALERAAFVAWPRDADLVAACVALGGAPAGEALEKRSPSGTAHV